MRPRRRHLSVGQQAFALRAFLPDAEISFGTGNFLTVVSDIQPTPVSRRYTIRIRYRDGDVPKVHVLSPELRLHPGANALPHIFPGDSLCLHLPGQWRPTMFIAHTTIPWTSEWLLYYEIWLVTGNWTGGGHGEPQN